MERLDFNKQYLKEEDVDLCNMSSLYHGNSPLQSGARILHVCTCSKYSRNNVLQIQNVDQQLK